MTIANQYTQMGSFSVIPAADIASATSAANIKSAGRLGDEGIGKRAGMLALRYNGTDDYDLVIATGDTPTSKWMLYEAGTPVTPA